MFAPLMPIYAINIPIPPLIAFCRLSGMDFIILLRIFVTVIKMLSIPQIKTNANACSHENPRANTTV